MIAFSEASTFAIPHDAHPFNSFLPPSSHLITIRCLKRSDQRLPAFDSDDDDDDDDSFVLERPEETYLDDSRRLPSKSPVSNSPTSKNSVKLVAKLPVSVSEKTKSSNLRARERSSEKENRGFPDFEFGSMRLTRLSSSRWEEQAYEIVRQQKLRRITAAQQNAKRKKEADASSQILSLSLESSLKPKSDYLIKELKCGVQVVTSFPAYFSLSLEQRIRPRHEFLRTLNRCPQGSFPMHLLAVTDNEFCKRWANSTVEEYNSFRQEMQLSSFAKKFERKNRLQFEPR